jgi:MFS family permease
MSHGPEQPLHAEQTTQSPTEGVFNKPVDTSQPLPCEHDKTQTPPIVIYDGTSASYNPTPLPEIDEPPQPVNSNNDEDMMSPPTTTTAPAPTAPAQHHGFRFYMALAGLLLAALLTCLDGGTISTALPTIGAELSLGADYVWVANAYFLTMAAFQPLCGQLADLWGRRVVFLATVAVFVLGSGVIGGAQSGAALIAGRAVQGLGAGGINVLVDLVVCDLVPLRERGKYMGMVFGIGTTVSALGPFVAGALTQAGPGAWRWIFWMNLPIGAACMVIMILWLRVGRPPRQEGDGVLGLGRLRRVDWVGTGIVVASTVAVLYGLAYGGAVRPWSDGGVIASLVAGLAGLVLFLVWEGTPWCTHPLAPLRLFSNRTSAVAMFLTLTNALIIFWVVFMFPVYFQAVLGASPQTSGLWLLPFAFTFPAGAALSGNLMTRLGRYRPLHLVGLALSILGFGLCTLLDGSSHMAVWVVLQMVLSLSMALPVATLLPAVQAPLSDADAASSTATWAFLRSIGSVFGAAVPAAVFNDRFAQLLGLIDDPAARAVLADGRAYSEVSAGAALSHFTGQTRDQVVHVYVLSLQRVWYIGIVFAGFSFLVTFLEKEVPMRQELVTEFGLDQSDTEPEKQSGRMV